MARQYRYETSRQALYEPAIAALFFEEWTSADTANHDLLCAELSRLAYASRDVVTEALASVGFSPRQWIGGEGGRERLRARGTDGFVAASHDAALTVAVFRGTEANKPEDVIADLIVVPAAWADGGRVHAGFKEAYSAERDEIRAALDQHNRGHLLITGHSLGAAVATLAAADHHMKNPTLITFGSPRVGDEEFKARLGRVTCRRFVNCCDIVTRIPPESFAPEPILTLLCELAGSPPSSSDGLWAVRALCGLLQPLTSEARFSHVGDELYADQHGALRAAVAPTTIKEDQAAARSSYPDGPRPGVRGLLAELTHLTPIMSLEKQVRSALLAFAKGLFAGDHVPLRDLADHAPINYVSIFTGRA